jgi:hypothetical protein
LTRTSPFFLARRKRASLNSLLHRPSPLKSAIHRRRPDPPLAEGLKPPDIAAICVIVPAGFLPHLSIPRNSPRHTRGTQLAALVVLRIVVKPRHPNAPKVPEADGPLTCRGKVAGSPESRSRLERGGGSCDLLTGDRETRGGAADVISLTAVRTGLLACTLGLQPLRIKDLARRGLQPRDGTLERAQRRRLPHRPGSSAVNAVRMSAVPCCGVARCRGHL